LGGHPSCNEDVTTRLARESSEKPTGGCEFFSDASLLRVETMTVLPSQLLVSVALGLAALAVLVVALALAAAAYRRRSVRTIQRSDGMVVSTAEAIPSRADGRRRALLGVATLLLVLVFAGHYLVGMTRPSAPDTRADERAITNQVTGASGAQLAVEGLGPADAPVIVFTHGWGADGREWSYYRPLADRYRLVIWDLPGLGASSPIPDGYTMEKLARDLRSVVRAAGDRPVILVGHSIGGMLNLTYARLFPEDLGGRVKGIVQFNTTYTNPLRTTKDAERHLARQKSLYEPLLNAVEVTSPVVRALGWLSYASGLSHLQLASQSFAGVETREQLDHAAKYSYRSSPAVVAAGVRAMMNWDASDAFARVTVPTLILTGAQDTTTLPEASILMKREIRQSSLVTVDPAAHLGPIEQNERYSTELRAFADRVLAMGANGARVQ
jgi:pimeloyl-ACP methyl ester carboxylesterase